MAVINIMRKRLETILDSASVQDGARKMGKDEIERILEYYI